jgi:hypothetical protein
MAKAALKVMKESEPKQENLAVKFALRNLGKKAKGPNPLSVKKKQKQKPQTQTSQQGSNRNINGDSLVSGEEDVDDQVAVDQEGAAIAEAKKSKRKRIRKRKRKNATSVSTASGDSDSDSDSNASNDSDEAGALLADDSEHASEGHDGSQQARKESSTDLVDESGVVFESVSESVTPRERPATWRRRQKRRKFVSPAPNTVDSSVVVN